MTPPTIDTTVARSMLVTKVKPLNDINTRPYLAAQEPRARSLSSASTSSSISVASPDPSSGNPSTSSLYLPSASGIRAQGSSNRNPSPTSLESQKLESTQIASTSEEIGDSRFSSEPRIEYVIALHDFVPQEQNATCLSFRAGENIQVLNRDPSGWWDGELDGRRGWFPSNYVNNTTSLPDEHPTSRRPRKGHNHSRSDAILATRVETGSNLTHSRHSSEDLSGDLPFPTGTSSTPVIMTSLLQGLQLLRNCTLARRTDHYNPSVACIIQCIRFILRATDCLRHKTTMLERFPVLAQERKRVLSELALLVGQSKKASGEYEREEEREADEELMLVLADRVFSRVQRFLSVAVDCGIELPERRLMPAELESSTTHDPAGTGETDSMQSQYGFNGDDEVYYPVTTLNKNVNNDKSRKSYEGVREGASTPSSSVGAGSTENWERLSSRRNTLEDRPSSTDSITPLIRHGWDASANDRVPSRNGDYMNTDMQRGAMVHHRYGSNHMSISSSSSFSSSSASDSPGRPRTPPFPEGVCSASQVQRALRSTHDNLLSTIAAFIGHTHCHSRSAHASSAGHLYALVRQIVDIVCKLLIIVEAVLGVDEIHLSKRRTLANAKDRVYMMACELADVVRQTVTTITVMTEEEEEEEYGHLRTVATVTLRAGADCVSAVGTCLARPLNWPSYKIILPSLPDTPTTSSSLGDAQESKRESVASNGTVLADSPSEEQLNELHEQVKGGYTSIPVDYDDDVTIQPAKKTIVESTATQRPSYDENSSLSSITLSQRDRQQFIAALTMDLPNAPTSEEEEVALVSSDERIEAYSEHGDDATTWEGSQRLHSSLEDKLINGELPSIPQSEDQPDECDAIPSRVLSYNYASHDVAYNSEGHLVGATLEALVEKMTPHDQIVDAAFAAVFFLTFRLFSTPKQLAEVLISRFNLEQPVGLSEMETEIWRQRKLLPVRLRVSNFIKLWLETYWRPGKDELALPLLQEFVKYTMADIFTSAAQRLEDLINGRLTAATQPGSPISPISERHRIGERLRDAGMPINPPFIAPSEIPRPIMTKTLLGSLRGKNFPSIVITDFDALELARQVTIMECGLYCAITADEMLEVGQQGSPPAVNVKAVSSLSTAITGWVAESILDEPDLKKRVFLVKFFIKVADRCTTLNNFSTPRSILAALDSSTISRLHQTWANLAQKTRLQLEALRKLADHARNYHEYRTRLRNTGPPAVPFLGLYLTDLTFCREGNPSHRSSPAAPEKKLLNFNKYHKLARIIQDMQRFQIPYNLKVIPEAQQYLQFCFDKTKDHSDLEDLYRRSQLLEPKQPTEAPSSELKTTLFSWGSRSQASSQTSQATLV